MSKMHFLVEGGKKDGVYFAVAACGLSRDSAVKWIGSKNPKYTNCTRCKKHLTEKGLLNDK